MGLMSKTLKVAGYPVLQAKKENMLEGFDLAIRHTISRTLSSSPFTAVTITKESSRQGRNPTSTIHSIW